MPKADIRWATSTPMRPRPTTPRVFSASSTPVYLLRFHSPFFSAAFACGMLRAVARIRPDAGSCDDLQFARGGDRLGVHLRGRADQDRVDVGEGGEQFGSICSVAMPDF